MKLIYIAGPFRGKNSWEMENNIRRAEELVLAAWKAGFAVICPHTNTRFYQGAAPDNVWLDGDLEILRRCDGVILVENWEKSEGTKAEIKEAKNRQIPVFQDVTSAWEFFQLWAAHFSHVHMGNASESRMKAIESLLGKTKPYRESATFVPHPLMQRRLESNFQAAQELIRKIRLKSPNLAGRYQVHLAGLLGRREQLANDSDAIQLKNAISRFRTHLSLLPEGVL